MKDQVKEMFAQITMPEETERKVRNAMEQNRKPKNRTFPVLARNLAAIAAMLALVMLISPEARAAVEKWVVKYVFPESGITVYEERDVNGEVVSVMAVDTESKAFAEYRDGRLYFTCNGVQTDITDQITEAEPFFYDYVDEYGLTHYRVVGYSGSMENFGIYEFLRTVEDGQQPWEGWEGGTGRNILDPETGTRYPWVDIVWEELNIPWPKPE